MRISTVALTVGVLAALSSMPAFAGQPVDPGAGGQINQAVKDFADSTGVTPAEIKKEVVDLNDADNWGQLKKDAVPDGRPTH